MIIGYNDDDNEWEITIDNKSNHVKILHFKTYFRR